MSDYYFDKIMNVKLYKVDEDGNVLRTLKDTMFINTTSSGLKPDMELEVSLLPEELCYACTLRIRNFMYVPDIRDYSYMEIEAGYNYKLSKRTATFNIAIFTSYQESPNPDGITVFKGVTVGSTSSCLTDRTVNVTIYGEQPIGTIIRKTAYGAAGISNVQERFVLTDPTNGAGVIKIHSFLGKYENEMMSLPDKQKLVGSNGLALLSDLYYSMYSYFKRQYGLTYIQQYYNGTLEVGILEESPKLTSSESILPLISVYSASFNAQILTITAPWDPLAEPGRIVRISANYFNGNMAPNDLGNLLAPAQLNIPTATEIATGAGLYRILTSKVNFSTCRDTNKMELLLIPIQYARENEAGTQVSAKYEALKKNKKESLEIVIGNPTDENSTEKLFSKGLKGNYTYTEETLNVGTSFSALAIKYYDTIDTKDFYLNKKLFNKDIVLRILDDGTLVKGKYASSTLGIAIGRSWAWPLLLGATYSMYSQGDSNYKVNLNDPDTLPPGTKVRIPVLPADNEEAINQLKADKELFKSMGDYYISYINDSSKWWAREHAVKAYNMYLLAGGEL